MLTVYSKSSLGDDYPPDQYHHATADGTELKPEKYYVITSITQGDTPTDPPTITVEELDVERVYKARKKPPERKKGKR